MRCWECVGRLGTTIPVRLGAAPALARAFMRRLRTSRQAIMPQAKDHRGTLRGVDQAGPVVPAAAQGSGHHALDLEDAPGNEMLGGGGLIGNHNLGALWALTGFGTRFHEAFADIAPSGAGMLAGSSGWHVSFRRRNGLVSRLRRSASFMCRARVRSSL